MAATQKLTKDARLARDRKIWTLRCMGWTQAQIAVELGLSVQSISVVLEKQRGEYAAAHAEDVERQIADEAAALDESIRLWELRQRQDTRGSFRAGELVLRFRESRRKLLGLDRPAKLEVSGTVVTPIDLEIQELMSQLGMNDPTVGDTPLTPADNVNVES